MDKAGAKIIELRKLAFLKQVFWLSLTAFGGPQVHFTRFTDVLVKKRRFLSNEELLEINSFCQMLPGPTSTQTITTIAYRRGGPVFAALVLGIWALPSCVLMGVLAFIVSMCGNNANVDKVLQYIPFATGWLSNDGKVSGRPVDIEIAADGAMLISDDHRGAIYRIVFNK